ncbi:MAG: hypothetical protein C5B50_05770 [Verrucomicrobia bacterium]|nr:MAG: hypothetical protein C5B50_05770 [Verrucomicrobiota bacterium]
MLALLNQKPPAEADLMMKLDTRPYGVQKLAQQVLGGIGEKRETAMNVAFSASPVKYSPDEKSPIPAGLARHSVVKKLVQNQITGGDIKFSPGELKDFACEFYTVMSDPYDPQQYKILATAKSNSEIAFGNVLLGYFMAYQKGNFVRRDGTALGKPCECCYGAELMHSPWRRCIVDRCKKPAA